MKTSFLRGATTAISSRAEVLKLGRRVVFGQASTTDARGELVAHSTLTYARAVG
jgi:acyl-coenzyme A thioesterase PaaI-like protein